jgi:importin subunit alpha-2
MTRNAVWALSNLCRGKNPPPDFSKVSPALPVLARLLFHTDSDVLVRKLFNNASKQCFG